MMPIKASGKLSPGSSALALCSAGCWDIGDEQGFAPVSGVEVPKILMFLELDSPHLPKGNYNSNSSCLLSVY